MNSSNSSLSIARSFEANTNWTKVLCRAAVMAALGLLLANTARAQIQLLVNTNFEASPGTSGWTTAGNANIHDAGSTYYNAGTCAPDNPAQVVDILDGGSQVANSYGNFNSALNYTTWSQSFAAAPGATFTSGAWAYGSHEDISGPNNFYFEVDFYDISSTLLATYESYNVIGLECSQTNPPAEGSWPFPLDTWNYLAITNELQVTTGTNTGTVIGNTGPTGVFTSPPGTASVKFQATFVNINYAGGSIYFDQTALWQLSGAVPPVVGAVSPNNVILSTNTALTCTATSSGTITNVQLIITTTALGGTGSNTVTTNLTSANVTGLGTGSASVSYALTPNWIYNVTVVATDNNGISASSGTSFDTLSPTLVIEAEDFNFNGGGFTNTPPDGGLALFANAPLGVAEIDLQKNPGNGNQGADGSYYRSGDVIINGYAAPVNGTAQKYVTAAAEGDTVDVPIEVGYNGIGDWLDYTRTFGSDATNSGPNGTYSIWARLATDGGGDQLSFAQVTAGQGTSSQTLQQLGSFTFTDNNWNGFDYVPMLDQFGNLVSVTLSGAQTFRSTVVDNPNIDFYMLVPAVAKLTPSLQFAYPDGLHPFESATNLTFTVGPANGSNILSSGVHLVLNGVDVTSNPKFSLTAAGDSWTGSYPVLANAIYAAVIDVTNSAGLSSAFTIDFDTFNVNNFQCEFADYDYSTNGVTGGLFIDNPVPTCDINAPQTGTLATNSYFGYPGGLNGVSIALEGVDIGWVDGQPIANNYYRNDGVGTQPSGDYLRPQFVAAQQQFNDPNIGPFQIGYFDGGNWLNYTRHYPTNNFYVWSRLAGGAGPFSGTMLSLQTGGYGTATQSSNVLGTFADPNAVGWEAYHWIPLLDTNGAMVVVSLGGQQTLTLTSGNNLNAAFMMLVPAPTQAQLKASLVSGQLNLAFPTQSGHTYTIVTKSDLTAPTWTQVGSTISGTGSEVNVPIPLTGTQGYYTVGVQ